MKKMMSMKKMMDAKKEIEQIDPALEYEQEKKRETDDTKYPKL